jgi:hypothetical protein
MAERAIEICLDPTGRRVYSRSAGQEQASLTIGPDAGGTACLLDAAGAPLTPDQVSQFFLEKFLFAEPW